MTRWPYDEAVRSRLWAAGAAVWAAAAIAILYAAFHPVLWYVIVIAVAGVLALPGAIAGTEGIGRMLMLVAMGAFILAALIGGLKAGLILLPGIVASVLSVRASDANLTRR